MKVPKIHLSSTEIDLMSNADVILTKNNIMQKIKGLLEEVQQNQVSFTQKHNLISETGLFSVPSKISKGENYLGLPYIILDYPRISSPERFFFIRSMFWWGHFFSSTLQVGGEYIKPVKENLQDNLKKLLANGYYLGINTDPWIHHFKENNYIQIGAIKRDEFHNITDELNYIKIAAKWPLSDWNLAANNLYNSWELLLNLSGLIA
jgi:hypothetical protein